MGNYYVSLNQKGFQRKSGLQVRDSDFTAVSRSQSSELVEFPTGDSEPEVQSSRQALPVRKTLE